MWFPFNFFVLWSLGFLTDIYLLRQWNNYFRPWLVSLADSKLVYEWGNFLASKCVVEVYDDAMAQYEYKGANLSYKHGKFSSGT